MKKKITKLLPIVSMMAVSCVFGESEAKNFEQGMPVEEGQLQKGYSAPARTDVNGAWDFYVSGSFLYWQTVVDGLEYAMTSSDAVLRKGHIKNPKTKWKPGCKVGLGVNFEHDDWSLFAEWTHMLGRAKGHTGTVSAGNYLIPLSFDSFLASATSTCQQATGRGKANFNQVDFLLSRPYYSGKNLTVIPEFGIKGIWDKYRNVSSYTTVTAVVYDPSSVTYTLSSVKTVGKYRYWAVGPEFGVKSNWLMGCGFKVFGEAKGSLFYLRAKHSQKCTIPVGSALAADGVVFEAKLSKLNLIRSMFEGNAGFGWETYFDHCNWHFAVDLAYNFLYSPNIISVLGVQTDVARHGGNCTLRLDF